MSSPLHEGPARSTSALSKSGPAPQERVCHAASPILPCHLLRAPLFPKHSGGAPCLPQGEAALASRTPAPVLMPGLASSSAIAHTCIQKGVQESDLGLCPLQAAPDPEPPPSCSCLHAGPGPPGCTDLGSQPGRCSIPTRLTLIRTFPARSRPAAGMTWLRAEQPQIRATVGPFLIPPHASSVQLHPAKTGGVPRAVCPGTPKAVGTSAAAGT